MSPAAPAGSPPGPRSESPGTAGLWCAVWEAGGAWAGVRPRARPGAGGSGPGDGRVRHLVTDVGWGACGAVVRPSLGVLVGGRIAGPGPRRPESRGVTLPAQRQ